MHQVPALFLHRLGEGLQTRGVDRLPCGGDFGVHRGAVSSGFAGVVNDVKLNLGGHTLQRLEDVGIPHVIDGDIQRMLCALNEFDKLRNRFPIDLGAVGLEEKVQARRAERRNTRHITISFC